ncbi:helicase-related protein [Cryobacterium sp. Hh7]|uniref:helicase-related protein n=1 Tax=Cryobacterium sp. Hh7 TaxID=1259159 RepID=UPI001F545527|nr:helicase-related protein [Cryobacterium sp. Hh7]
MSGVTQSMLGQSEASTTIQEGHRDLAVAPGSIVVVRDAEWLVTSTEATTSGTLIRVQGLSELVRDSTAAFYSDIDDIVPLDPEQAVVVGDESAGYRTAKLWLEATLRKSPIPLNAPELTVSTRMLADPLAYQQAAVRKALDPENLRPRILIADAVGLGKTLEIGMILSELVRRGRGERILIVTPRHVLEQMQHEMWTRFALPFVRLDSVGIQRVRQKLPATRNPFSLYKRAIISIDTLKQEKYRSHLAKHKWDAVVIDESHNITGATLNNRLARILAPNTEALILASATPHNGKKESFAELIRLLEPTAVTPDGEIIESEVKRLIIRRHRHSEEVAREVGADWAERMPPQHFLVQASPAENAVANELADVWLHPENGSSPYSSDNGGLFPWTLAKAFLSSPAALKESVKERLKKVTPSADESQAREREALEYLGELSDAALVQPSAKYTKLVEYLKSIGVSRTGTERAVVFSERVATLHWLRAKLLTDLKLKDEQVRVLHGGLNDVEQQEIVESFKQSSSPIRVLITGDVASEGVNLHSQCHELIHFDIPWSLIRIEQRNGRIDRYGQKHRPQISTLLLDPANANFAGDIRVLKRVLDRENEAHGALGDAASLMGHYDAKLEEDDIRKVLAGKKNLDEAVPTTDHVIDNGDSIGALMARLAAAQSSPAKVTTAGATDTGSGLFADDTAFLREALQATFATPAASVSDNGVNWHEYPNHGLVSLSPTRDLAQRLEVLPQTYLRDRNVLDELKLVVSPQRGKALLQDARDNKASTSLWPEAHYLGPLHPVLEWASDRALSNLGRNQVFAVRGEVDVPTVLLFATLTNRRGQVVASSYITAQIPDPADPEFVLPTAHGTAHEALETIGFTGATAINYGAVTVDHLQGLIAPAVRAARALADQFSDASATTIEQRIDRWSTRVDLWEEEANALIQIKDLKLRRVTVEQERLMAESMKPHQQLVRPLLVVVPQDFMNENGTGE